MRNKRWEAHVTVGCSFNYDPIFLRKVAQDDGCAYHTVSNLPPISPMIMSDEHLCVLRICVHVASKQLIACY